MGRRSAFVNDLVEGVVLHVESAGQLSEEPSWCGRILLEQSMREFIGRNANSSETNCSHEMRANLCNLIVVAQVAREHEYQTLRNVH